MPRSSSCGGRPSSTEPGSTESGSTEPGKAIERGGRERAGGRAARGSQLHFIRCRHCVWRRELVYGGALAPVCACISRPIHTRLTIHPRVQAGAEHASERVGIANVCERRMKSGREGGNVDRYECARANEGIDETGVDRAGKGVDMDRRWTEMLGHLGPIRSDREGVVKGDVLLAVNVQPLGLEGKDEWGRERDGGG